MVRRAHRVTALVLAHEGAPWLPRSLEALARQRRPADVVVGIDAGSADPSADLLGAAVDHLVALPDSPGIAAALASGVEWVTGAGAPGVQADGEPAPAESVPAESVPAEPRAAPGAAEEVDWYWIVHDDCAPEPECLRELLAGADRNPAAHVLVPKGVSWSDPARLIAIGNKWAPGTPVVERLESRERDQGQYDVDRPVYVGDSAGLLVRADAWQALGGMDPEIGDWAAAADLCRRVWGTGGEVVFIPDAVVAHRSAGRRGVRAGIGQPTAPRRAARRGQLMLELTQPSGWALAWRYVRAWISTAVRAVVLLVTTEPEEATAQLVGAWDVLGHPGRIRASRASVRRQPVDLRRPPHLRAYRGAVVQHALDGWTATTPARERRRWRLPARVWQPMLMTGALAVAAIARTPEALFGSGTLRGGGLLPAPGALDLVSGYLSGWHDVRFGTPVALPAYLPMLSLGSVGLLGSVDLLLRLCFVLAVPLAFLSAYLSIGPVLVGRERMALALGYAFLPAGAAAMGAGRVSTLGLLLLAPPTARLVVNALTRARRPGTGIRAAIAGGTMLGITCAFAPLAYPLALGAALAGWGVSRFARWPVRNGLIVLGVAALFLVLWAPRAWAAPWLVLSDLGRNDPTLAAPEPWVWGLAPGGPTSVGWAGVPLVVVAVLAAVLRPTRRAWLAIACASALLAAVAWQQALVRAVWPEVDPGTLWPGQLLLVAGALLVLVVARTAALSPRLGIGATTAWWGCVGVLALGWWTAPSIMGVSQDSGLPPVVALDTGSPAQPRALVLSGWMPGSTMRWRRARRRCSARLMLWPGAMPTPPSTTRCRAWPRGPVVT